MSCLRSLDLSVMRRYDTTHAWTDPIERMIKTATEKSVKFVAPMPGQPVDTDKPIGLNKWWRKPMT